MTSLCIHIHHHIAFCIKKFFLNNQNVQYSFIIISNVFFSLALRINCILYEVIIDIIGKNKFFCNINLLNLHHRGPVTIIWHIIGSHKSKTLCFLEKSTIENILSYKFQKCRINSTSDSQSSHFIYSVCGSSKWDLTFYHFLSTLKSNCPLLWIIQISFSKDHLILVNRK